MWTQVPPRLKPPASNQALAPLRIRSPAAQIRPTLADKSVRPTVKNHHPKFMVRKSNSRSRTALSRACYFTALFNGLVVPGFAQEALPQKPPEGLEPLKYGPFDVLYGIRGSVVYDDNIFISPHKVSDFI